MEFIPDRIFYVYNEGNNQMPIFFKEENYHFFQGKMRKHLLPYADLLTYCLLPDSFLWLIYVFPEGCLPSRAVKPVRAKTTRQDLPASYFYQQALCRSIGTLLSSYTRAINKQQNRSGSLFRSKTKARDYQSDLPLPGIEPGMIFANEADFAAHCLQFFHHLPLGKGLVNHPADWPHSSFHAYRQQNGRNFCNPNRARQLLLPRPSPG